MTSSTELSPRSKHSRRFTVPLASLRAFPQATLKSLLDFCQIRERDNLVFGICCRIVTEQLPQQLDFSNGFANYASFFATLLTALFTGTAESPFVISLCFFSLVVHLFVLSFGGDRRDTVDRTFKFDSRQQSLQ